MSSQIFVPMLPLAPPSNDNHANAHKPTNIEILTRSTLALRYLRRGAISQDMADAVGELMTHYAHQNVW